MDGTQDEQSKYGLETVRRAIALMRCFSLEEPELGVTELSRRLDVHKSTVSRLLATLESESLVVRNAETGRYRLSVGLIELASLAVLGSDLRAIARPMLCELAEQTKETVNLAVWDQDGMVNVELIPSLSRRVSNFGWVGRRTPLHASSTGKVFMAHLPESEWRSVLEDPLTSYTEHTITDPDALREEFVRIRKRGYATGLEELEIGLNAVAAPIMNHTGQVEAAVSTAGPSYRLSLEQIEEHAAKSVTACAENISKTLGYHAKRPEI
jgi:IclR family acetate operon transcriptional repressor